MSDHFQTWLFTGIIGKNEDTSVFAVSFIVAEPIITPRSEPVPVSKVEATYNNAKGLKGMIAKDERPQL